MKRLQPLLLLTLPLLTNLGIGSCSDRSLGSADGGPKVDAGATEGGSAGTVACNDGTGAMDCCAGTTTERARTTA